ncbi:hypothetical protein AAFF_G00055890 [Aldrovandia affinis]|uniref:FERM, ARHGEF and pleckstrin domain-containing protein 1 n=1 Tax=Aldrovandia affinis TaxID=143900 RepID=A0AAD7S0X6_9TELE|nr:hypothetical protein AAFF_G00055890 [Aldrovandia affinis]
MVEPDVRPTAGQRLGAQESLGISTLEPGHRPPAMPAGRHVAIKVRMLDDTEEVFDVSQRAPGKALFALVCTHLNLIEGDYFSLEFLDYRKMAVWLDLLKPIVKQIRRPKQTVLRFVVKFFPPDHTQLLEELTRYLFALQIKQDLLTGRLTCNDSSAALMVSHIVQSEIGDFEEAQNRQHLLTNKYIPDQEALMDKIIEFHRKHVGQTPAESDYQLLEVARRLEMYGIRLHPAKDREGTKLNLSVAHTGVLVFQGHMKINAFNWSKVRKLSFKRKRFLIKLRPDLNQSTYQDTLEFVMGSRDCCKVFWKICVEYHAFFRLFEEPKPKPRPVLFTRGSSFRFSGRTQKQVIDYVKDSEFKKIPFERKHSKVQSNSSLSPLASQLRSPVPKESARCPPGDKPDSPSRPGWREATPVSAEDRGGPRKRGSPSAALHNGREDHRAGPRDEEARGGQPSPPHRPQDHLSTGPASRAAKGSSSSIPYIDCSDIDSEYDVAKGRVTRSHSRTNDNDDDEDEPVVAASRGHNGAYGHYERDRPLGKARYRESPPFSAPPLELLDDEGSSASLYAGQPHGPLHSTLVDEMFRGSAQRSPLVVSRSSGSSPVRWDDGGHSFSSRPGAARQTQAQRYGSYSPVVARPPHPRKGARDRSDTDPLLLSQLTSTPAREPRPLLSRAERMAALERRMVANGLSSAPGPPPKGSPGQRLYGRPKGCDHHVAVASVQMIDGSTSSGTDSSDSESETGSSCSHPLVYGNPIAGGASPMPRSKFSFGSLQLEEELTEEDGCFNFSDEDGARVFSSLVASSPRLSDSCGHSRGMVNGQKQGLALGHSPDGRLPSPLTSPLLNDAGYVRTDDEDEVRRKRFPTDKAYFIAKELLTTERTYLKDLEVITVAFQNSVGKDEAMPDSLRNVICSNFDPLYKFHTGFLKEVEQRLALWEGRSNAHIKGDYQRIGDVMLNNVQGMKQLSAHLQKHSEALLELERACRSSRRVEALCRDFELQKVCYLPLNIFLLRPLHRLTHYKQILERLCRHYPPTHQDFRDSRAALADVSEMVLQLHGPMIKMENFQKLLELKKDLVGIDNLAIPGREFIRLGCLSKLSGKGLQQRMFFLFSDILLYTSRGMTASNQFKVHGQLPLHGMKIRESEEEWGVPYSFTLSGQRQSVVVAASSVLEMEKWMEDIVMAIDLAEKCNGHSADLLTSLSDSKCLEDSSLEQESEDDLSASRTSLERPAPHRGNTTVHVCWHRNTCVSMVDFSVAVENQLSGNLLRKFKNSNGWQKLWVVFTNFSLFFYKSHQDDYPLASLPLLGYSVTIPSETENIHKDYVFKLHFKSHVYYFRSESEYTFERWMEVIRSATSSASRPQISSYKEPHPY